MGEDRGVWTPYPRGSTPLPHPIFSSLPPPPFFLNFFQVPPAQNSGFCPTLPTHLPPCPLFVKSHPTPVPLTPGSPSPCSPPQLRSNIDWLLFRIHKWHPISCPPWVGSRKSASCNLGNEKPCYYNAWVYLNFNILNLHLVVPGHQHAQCWRHKVRYISFILSLNIYISNMLLPIRWHLSKWMTRPFKNLLHFNDWHSLN